MVFKLFLNQQFLFTYFSFLFKRYFFYDNITALEIWKDVFLKWFKKKMQHTHITFLNSIH